MNDPGTRPNERKSITVGETLIALVIFAAGILLFVTGFRTYSTPSQVLIGMAGAVLLFSILPLYVAIFLVYHKRPEGQKKKEREETVRVIVFLLWVAFLFTLLPASVIFVYNFTKLVVLGGMEPGDFFGSFPRYTYEPVFDFYVNMCEKGAHFIYRR